MKPHLLSQREELLMQQVSNEVLTKIEVIIYFFEQQSESQSKAKSKNMHFNRELDTISCKINVEINPNSKNARIGSK